MLVYAQEVSCLGVARIVLNTVHLENFVTLILKATEIAKLNHIKFNILISIHTKKIGLQNLSHAKKILKRR